MVVKKLTFRMTCTSRPEETPGRIEAVLEPSLLPLAVPGVTLVHHLLVLPAPVSRAPLHPRLPQLGHHLVSPLHPRAARHLAAKIPTNSEKDTKYFTVWSLEQNNLLQCIK